MHDSKFCQSDDTILLSCCTMRTKYQVFDLNVQKFKCIFSAELYFQMDG